MIFFSVRGSLRNTLGFNQPNISPPAKDSLPGTGSVTMTDIGSLTLSSQQAYSDSIYVWDGDRLDWIALGIYSETLVSTMVPRQDCYAKNEPEKPGHVRKPRKNTTRWHRSIKYVIDEIMCYQ